jgi:hypothetical protein
MEFVDLGVVKKILLKSYGLRRTHGPMSSRFMRKDSGWSKWQKNI